MGLRPEQPLRVSRAAHPKALNSLVGYSCVKVLLDGLMLGRGELRGGVHNEGSLPPGMGAEQMQEACKASQGGSCIQTHPSVCASTEGNTLHCKGQVCRKSSLTSKCRAPWEAHKRLLEAAEDISMCTLGPVCVQAARDWWPSKSRARRWGDKGVGR